MQLTHSSIVRQRRRLVLCHVTDDVTDWRRGEVEQGNVEALAGTEVELQQTGSFRRPRPAISRHLSATRRRYETTQRFHCPQSFSAALVRSRRQYYTAKYSLVERALGRRREGIPHLNHRCSPKYTYSQFKCKMKIKWLPIL